MIELHVSRMKCIAFFVRKAVRTPSWVGNPDTELSNLTLPWVRYDGELQRRLADGRLPSGLRCAAVIAGRRGRDLAYLVKCFESDFETGRFFCLAGHSLCNYAE